MPAITVKDVSDHCKDIAAFYAALANAADKGNLPALTGERRNTVEFVVAYANHIRALIQNHVV
jgi:hypothetical protein